MMALDLLFRPNLLPFTILIVQYCTLTSSVSEFEALIKLKESFTNASRLSSWTPGSIPCKGQDHHWVGLHCHNESVTGLRLENMGLSGKFDVDALVDIKGLRTLNFAYNSFSGEIPGLNRLGRLRAVYLSGNQFSGSIPPDFFSKMESLTRVWLADNKFIGGIPSSLAALSHLVDLHLEGNQFSGAIPDFKQATLMTFNVSDNNLEGGIPPNLARFDMDSFQGNAGLCGQKFGKACTSTSKSSSLTLSPFDSNAARSEVGRDDTKDLDIKTAGLATLSVMLFSVGVFVVVKLMQKERSETPGRISDPEDSVAVQVSMPTGAKQVEVKKKTRSSREGSHHKKSGNVVGDFVVVNDEKGVFGLPDLMKASAEILGNSRLGSSYKAVMANGLAVVVKRTREANAMGKDGFEAEVRKLARLHHTNVLTPLAFHYGKDEKLLIYEYVPKGSLLYLLHGDRGPLRAELDWSARLKIVQGIVRGLSYLHAEFPSSELPHVNLKSSNVLLSADNEPLLSEFGFSPLIHPTVAAQALLAYKAPKAVQHGVSPKCDVYCLGLLILEILTGKFPSQYLSSGKGGTDVVHWEKTAISEGKESELLDPDIASSTNSLGEMIRLLHIGVICAETDPNQRLDLMEAAQRIKGIKLEGGHTEARTIQVLPSLRDGYADGPQANVSSLKEGYGEHRSRRHILDSFTDRRESQNGDDFSFTVLL